MLHSRAHCANVSPLTQEINHHGPNHALGHPNSRQQQQHGYQHYHPLHPSMAPSQVALGQDPNHSRPYSHESTMMRFNPNTRLMNHHSMSQPRPELMTNAMALNNLPCPQCQRIPSYDTCTRLVGEACGHFKCRQCLLREDFGCIQCKKMQNENAMRGNTGSHNHQSMLVRAESCGPAGELSNFHPRPQNVMFNQGQQPQQLPQMFTSVSKANAMTSKEFARSGPHPTSMSDAQHCHPLYPHVKIEYDETATNMATSEMNAHVGSKETNFGSNSEIAHELQEDQGGSLHFEGIDMEREEADSATSTITPTSWQELADIRLKFIRVGQWVRLSDFIALDAELEWLQQQYMGRFHDVLYNSEDNLETIERGKQVTAEFMARARSTSSPVEPEEVDLHVTEMAREIHEKLLKRMVQIPNSFEEGPSRMNGAMHVPKLVNRSPVSPKDEIKREIDTPADSQVDTMSNNPGKKRVKRKRNSIDHQNYAHIVKKNHLDPPEYLCSICTRQFKNRLNIRYHIACADKSAGHACKECDRIFKSSSHLTYHMRTAHGGEKPYKCRFCEKAFAQSVKLKRHERTHTGERPFKCEICQHTFTTKYNLKEHENIHKSEKPYLCTICGAGFADRNNLRRHENTHESSNKSQQATQASKATNIQKNRGAILETLTSTSEQKVSSSFTNDIGLFRHTSRLVSQKLALIKDQFEQSDCPKQPLLPNNHGGGGVSRPHILEEATASRPQSPREKYLRPFPCSDEFEDASPPTDPFELTTKGDRDVVVPPKETSSAKAPNDDLLKAANLESPLSIKLDFSASRFSPVNTSSSELAMDSPHMMSSPHMSSYTASVDHSKELRISACGQIKHLLRRVQGDEIYRVVDTLTSKERRTLIDILRTDSEMRRGKHRPRIHSSYNMDTFSDISTGSKKDFLRRYQRQILGECGSSSASSSSFPFPTAARSISAIERQTLMNEMMLEVEEDARIKSNMVNFNGNEYPMAQLGPNHQASMLTSFENIMKGIHEVISKQSEGHPEGHQTSTQQLGNASVRADTGNLIKRPFLLDQDDEED